MAWTHRTVYGNHEWRYEERRTFGDRDVWATAIVTAGSGDSDAPANWDVERDGSPISRGHSRSVKDAKSAAFKALWKARRRR